MEFFTQNQIPPADQGELLFRTSPWGALAAHLFLLLGLTAALALFVYTFFIPEISGFHWLRILLGLYILLMLGICRITHRAFAALRKPGNWLARIGPGGLMIHYRSYLHEDSPSEDPIAVQLLWKEIRQAYLQTEIFHTYHMDEKTENRRLFLTLQLDGRYFDPENLEAALAFEHQRKPAHFKVDELKHELFTARKSKATKTEIARLKEAIKEEKRRHPGRPGKARFQHRPVIFKAPDMIQVEWSQVTPGKKTLVKLLDRFTSFSTSGERHLHADAPLTEEEFTELLSTLVARDEKIEAIKLARQHKGCSMEEARDFVEKG